MNKTVIKYVRNTLFILFTLWISTYILLELFAPDKTVDIIGYKTFIVISSSMEPDIMVNDMIIIRKTKEEDLSVGDAITFNVYLKELESVSKVTHYIGDIRAYFGLL